MCRIAVAKNGDALFYVPDGLKTAETCFEAVRQDGRALQFVPKELKTPEVCEAAVRQNGYALQYVPEELKIPELCRTAVRQNGFALKFVPDALRTEDMCLEAYASECVKETFAAGPPVFRNMGERELACLAPADAAGSFRFWQKASAANARFKRFLPPPPKAALRQARESRLRSDGFRLKDVPRQELTERQCLLAVREKGYALQYAPDELKTPDVCLAAVKADGNALEFVPDALKTEALCMAAVKADGKALQYVPYAMRKEDACRAAAAQNPCSLMHAPKAMRADIAKDLLLGRLKQEPNPKKAKRKAEAAGKADRQELESFCEIACRRFAEAAGEAGAAPEGCALRLAVRGLSGGRIECRIAMEDKAERFYEPGKAPAVSAVYRPKEGAPAVLPEQALRAFAEKLEGRAGRPIKGMPLGMRHACACALRKACEPAAEFIEEEDNGTPRP